MKHHPVAISLLTFCLLFGHAHSVFSDEPLQNPIIPGYFADPSIVQHEGKFFMYATVDPWGADYLACWSSEDFRNWSFHKLNWPTKQACTSPTSLANRVWAPSVVKKDDQFFMYISVGSEVWCGKASHPLGPWENMLGDKPMIPHDTTRYYHVIDAEAFLDDDGKTYLYWGSGWGWVNGHCFAAELNEDMCSFKAKPVEVTPEHYFEAPFMVKHNGKYYLTYSEGKTVDETYEVRYAVGDNPFGPFTEAKNSPILKMDKELDVYGPGHHTVFPFRDKQYVLYHRHRLPFKKGDALRQICINEMTFSEDKDEINVIVPLHTQQFPVLDVKTRTTLAPASLTASSQSSEFTSAEKAMDGNFATLWKPSDDDKNAWLSAMFSSGTDVGEMEIRFEFPGNRYYPKVEVSTGGGEWKSVADHTETGISGSPVSIMIGQKVDKVRISFTQKDNTSPSVWDLIFYHRR